MGRDRSFASAKGENVLRDTIAKCKEKLFHPVLAWSLLPIWWGRLRNFSLTWVQKINLPFCENLNALARYFPFGIDQQHIVNVFPFLNTRSTFIPNWVNRESENSYFLLIRRDQDSQHSKLIHRIPVQRSWISKFCVANFSPFSSSKQQPQGLSMTWRLTTFKCKTYHLSQK